MLRIFVIGGKIRLDLRAAPMQQELAKVVWSDGMYLAPHHFQAQSRFFEHGLQFAISTLWSNTYGVAACDLDGAAVSNGTVALLRAEGILPDGLPFQMPGSDPLPPQRSDLRDSFDPARDSIDIMLAVSPEPDPVSGVEPAVPRFIAKPDRVADENNGKDVKEVQFARKNIRLLFDFEAEREGAVAMPIARITRRLSGDFAYDDRFIPPCLRLGPSAAVDPPENDNAAPRLDPKKDPRVFDAIARLTGLVRGLTSALEDKSNILAAENTAGPASHYGSRELAHFWLRHTVNRGLSVVRHLRSTRPHPEELYLELTRLAGALCTFIIGSEPQSLPAYDHARPARCFEQLESHIYDHLNVIFPKEWVSVSLVEEKDSYYYADVAEDRWLGPSRWVFGIKSPSLGDAETIARTPRSVRICSRAFIERLVTSALSGLQLRYLATPPSEFPAKPDHHYFAVSKAGPCWDHIIQTKRIGVHVAAEIPRPVLELFIAFEDGGPAS